MDVRRAARVEKMEDGTQRAAEATWRDERSGHRLCTVELGSQGSSKMEMVRAWNEKQRRVLGALSMMFQSDVVLLGPQVWTKVFEQLGNGTILL